MLLENKTAVVYGGAGAIGGAVAPAPLPSARPKWTVS